MKKLFSLLVFMFFVMCSNVSLAADVEIPVDNKELAIGWFTLGMNIDDAKDSCSNIKMIDRKEYVDLFTGQPLQYTYFWRTDDYTLRITGGDKKGNIPTNTVLEIIVGSNSIYPYTPSYDFKTPSGAYIGMTIEEFMNLYSSYANELQGIAKKGIGDVALKDPTNGDRLVISFRSDVNRPRKSDKVKVYNISLQRKY